MDHRLTVERRAIIDPTDGKTYRSTIDGNVYGPPSQYPQRWETYT